MSKGFNLLRVEYIFTVAVPILFCIFINGYELLDNLEILGAFGFWAICGNVLNDIFDMKNPDDKETLERTEGYRRKELAAIALTAFILGAALFIKPVVNHPEILLYLIGIVLMVVLYCTVLKPVVVFNWVFLGISHIWFPYFIVRINAGDVIMGWPAMEVYEYFLLACASAVALVGNLLHEIIDGEAISKLPLKTQRNVVWVSSITTFGIIGITVLLFKDILWDYALYFAPVALLPLGTMFMARSENTIKRKVGRTSLKDIGIISGNLICVFLIILIVVQ